MKILIVSGFLGAGKTTFIQRMTKLVRRNFAVYENEYAGVGIDSARLREDDLLRVYESTENCICCSGKADFAASILTIFCSLNPEYLIVEPTGLARLSRILETAQRILYGELAILKPVLIVDGPAFWSEKLKFPDIFMDQLHNAQFILISKTDMILSEELDLIRSEISKANPKAIIITKPLEDLDAGFFESLLSQKSDDTEDSFFPEGIGSRLKSGQKPSADKSGHPGPESVLSVVTKSPVDHIEFADFSLPSLVDLITFLNALSWGSCGCVERAKGTVLCGGEWIKFDFVENTWVMTGDHASECSRCAIIGTNILRDKVKKYLHAEPLDMTQLAASDIGSPAVDTRKNKSTANSSRKSSSYLSSNPTSGMKIMKPRRIDLVSSGK